MRTAFAQELTRLAAEDPRIVLLVGDIGNSLFNDFRERFPDRFINCGIAEQNMVSMAGGMASQGLRPVCFTIAPFLTARCFEQIKIDLGYHNVPVVLAAVGAGLCYANLGPTHQALDDIAILRTVPNLKIAAPATKNEARSCLAACLREDGPTYLRLGRDGEDEGANEQFQFGGWSIISSWPQSVVNVLWCGPLATMAPQIKGIGEFTTHYRCTSVRPTPPMDLHTYGQLVVTVEEHGITGGFGAAVAEWMADHHVTTPLLRIGTPDAFLPSPMSPAEAREYCGLTPERIAQRIRDELSRLR